MRVTRVATLAHGDFANQVRELHKLLIKPKKYGGGDSRPVSSSSGESPFPFPNPEDATVGIRVGQRLEGGAVGDGSPRR
jgi:hypothetical protein